MESSIEVEVVVRDTTEHPPADVVLSPQWKTEFQSGSRVTSQNPASPPPLDANVANENVLTSILTPDGIRTIKQRNPIEALWKLQQIRHLSTDVPPSSTIVGASFELHAEVVFILQQLKASLFDDKILGALEREWEITRDVFKFLDSLAIHDLPALMVKYFVEFEAFFTQFSKNMSLRQNVDLQIKMKLNEVKIEWDSSEAYERELDGFEHKKE